MKLPGKMPVADWQNVSWMQEFDQKSGEIIKSFKNKNFILGNGPVKGIFFPNYD